MTVLDFNPSNHSDQPINIALNAIIDASVVREETRGYLGASAVGHAPMIACNSRRWREC